MTYSFTVYSDKNPVPYKRTTQKAKFVDPGYKKYQAYKNLIVKSFVEKYKKMPYMFLNSSDKVYVHIVAYYRDKTHGDTDNIAKGANDALFQKPLSDKYVAGSYDYFYDKDNPRLEISIIV